MSPKRRIYYQKK